MRVRLTADRLAVCRLDHGSTVPSWASATPGFFAMARTADELSIVCSASVVPPSVRHEAPFRLLHVVGPLPFDAVGIMAQLSSALARAEISILPVATFDTDYVLIRECDVERGLEALRASGCVVDAVEAMAGPGAPPAIVLDGHWDEAPALGRLAGSARVAVVVATLDGRIREANDVMLDLIGYSRAEIADPGLTLQAISWPGCEEADEAAMLELRTRRVATPYEKELNHHSGRRVPVLAVGSLSGRAGEPLVQWIVVDLTERRRAERALRESERRFRLLADAAPVLVWTAGADEQRSFVNRRWITFTGRRADDDLGWGWIDAVHPEDRDRVRRTYETAFASRQVFRLEYRLRRRDGHYRWIIDDGAPLADDTGAFLGFVGASVDVTSRRQAEELREALLVHERRARSEAERVSRLKDDFLGTLSHELRTPLNTILGWTQVLRRSPDPLVPRTGIEVIDRNARTLTHLVDDLLDVSRLVSGDIHLSLAPVDLAAVLRAAVSAARPMASACDVTLECELAEPLPALAGDAVRLQQVAWNLLSNAIKFTPAGGRVRLEAQPEDAHVRIVVADTGRGIAPEFLPEVFDRFSQADSSASRLYGGLGLGLAIVRHLVELHGGTVGAASEGVGRGARFTVRLPRARGAAA